MKIMITGAKGFVGQNLVALLKNIQQNKDRTRNISIDNIYEYDIDTDISLLEGYCKDYDFIFNLVGVIDLRIIKNSWKETMVLLLLY